MLTSILIFGSIFLLSIALSWTMRRRKRLRDSARMRYTMPLTAIERYPRIPRDPEEHYVEGVGYVIGNVHCRYNARSPYLRCAIAPNGLCSECPHYEDRPN